MRTLRLNPPTEWRSTINGQNNLFLGFLDLLRFLEEHLTVPRAKMIEIGSYMGESTMLFSATGLFSSIYSIDPFGGPYTALVLDHDWDLVRGIYKNNVEHLDNIIQIENYSYNVVDRFEDESIDFIYIDGSHDADDVRRDIELYLPKLNKQTGIIAGHDYNIYSWREVVEVVDELLGKPEQVFRDTSWLTFVKNI